jgi:hypothetical protein
MSPTRCARAGRVSAKLIIAIVSAIVLALIVSSYFFLLRSGPEQVVRQYLIAVSSQDVPTMLTLMRSELADKNRAESEGKPFPEPIKNPQIPEMEIGKAEIKGDYAYVPVKLKTGINIAYAPSEETLRVALVKEGGQWKVDPLATGQAPPEGMGGMAPPMESLPPGPGGG